MTNAARERSHGSRKVRGPLSRGGRGLPRAGSRARATQRHQVGSCDAKWRTGSPAVDREGREDSTATHGAQAADPRALGPA